MEFTTKIVDSLTQKDIALHFKHEVYNNGDYSRFLQHHDGDAEPESGDEKGKNNEPEEIEDPVSYNKTKEELKQYIRPENQKKFRRKVVEKREMKFRAGEIAPAGSRSLADFANFANDTDLDQEGQELFNLACPTLPPPPTEDQIISSTVVRHQPSEPDQIFQAMSNSESPKEHSISQSFLKKRLNIEPTDTLTILKQQKI